MNTQQFLSAWRGETALVGGRPVAEVARRFRHGSTHLDEIHDRIRLQESRDAATAKRSAGRRSRRTLLERVDTSGGRLVQPGLIEGVCVLGLASRNRRRYLPEAVREALGLYEGAPVFIDHPSTPKGSRSVRDRFGRLTDVRFDGGKVRANLRYSPEHPFAAQLEWAAEHDPGFLGLSHNVEAEGVEEADGSFAIQRITNVRSVDLVSDPATTVGLWESRDFEPEIPHCPTHRVREILKQHGMSDSDRLADLLSLCNECEAAHAARYPGIGGATESYQPRRRAPFDPAAWARQYRAAGS